MDTTKGITMYSHLIEQVRGIKDYWEQPYDLWPDNIIRRALDGTPFPLDYALRIWSAYFEGVESMAELFETDDPSEARAELTFSETVHILKHSFLGEVIPNDAYDGINHYLYHAQNKHHIDYMAAGYAVGRVAGIREERARRHEKEKHRYE